MKMKFISFLFVIATLASCSSSDSDGGGSTDTSTVVLNGTTLDVTSAVAQRSEDTFAISADIADGTSVQLLFNKQGNLEEFSVWEDIDTYFNYQYYKSHYFTFNLISVNESTHRIKVSFSGTIYQDETDLSSDSKEVSGTFDLPYIVQTPAIAGLGLHCKIAGNDWYETQFWDNGWSDVDRKCISDDENMIIMRFADETITPGTYTFTTASENKMQLGKFDTATENYVEYNTSGTLTITSNTENFGFRIIEGTYSFTATNPSNPSNQVQVTNGTFKLNF